MVQPFLPSVTAPASFQQSQLSFNVEPNVPLPPRHLVVDAEPGRDALVVVEHQLPEMEIQQQITDDNQISRIIRRNIRQTVIENLKSGLRT